MNPTRTAEGVLLGGNALQQFHEARGYGTPTDTNSLLVTPVEAAHLLYRGDISDVDGDSFCEYLSSLNDESIATRFLVYKDFRDRGFYLRPAGSDHPGVDYHVFKRGTRPSEGKVAHEVRVIDERTPLSVDSLRPGVLAFVDEEGEIGYVTVDHWEPAGTVGLPEERGISATLAGNRVLVPDPPQSLYHKYFFGQPLAGRTATEGVVQLSLVEAIYLHERDIITISAADVRDRARSIEGPHFDPRLAVYTALRDAGIVTKTGYKFGADFRLYPSFSSVEDMGHSTALVRVRLPTDTFQPHNISLDVRLAHGVGKRMLFALRQGPADNPISWISIQRITP